MSQSKEIHSVLAVGLEIVVGLGSSTFPPWSRASPAHSGIYPMTQQDLSRGPGGRYTCCIGSKRPTEYPTMDPEVDPCPRAILLNKLLEAVPSTRGQTFRFMLTECLSGQCDGNIASGLLAYTLVFLLDFLQKPSRRQIHIMWW